MGLTHFDEARRTERRVGHLQGTWTLLGEAAGCVGTGVRRIQVSAGGWSTPAHEHALEEEIFYVLAGRGVSWRAGSTAEIGAGDCIVYPPGGGAHSVHAIEELDLLAFGPRLEPEVVGFPRLGMSLVGGRAVDSVPRLVDGELIQFAREAEAGPPELPEPGPRPGSIVNLHDVAAQRLERPRVARIRRDLGRAAGSRTTGLTHVEVAPGKLGAPLHCHSIEEEVFVVLEGEGVLILDDAETPVRTGHVVARPAGTGIAHTFRAGDGGLAFLAYGTREPGDVCFYPTSNKVAFRGLGVIARIERLDYWDGED